MKGMGPMPRSRNVLLTLGIVALALACLGNVPAQPRRTAALDFPVGEWRIEFDNGVVEVCTVRRDGSALVVEPLRTSGGKTTVERKAFVIACDDDRTERWVPSGKRMLVEHYFPGSQRASVTPVRGIAAQTRPTP